jgi:endo-1,4-beta-xylanase
VYVLAEVADATKDAGDAVEIFVDANNGKTAAYEADDRAYKIKRDGKHPAGVKAEAKAIPGGYRIEAAVPISPALTTPRALGFDIRFSDASRPTEVMSWNDARNGQDADTSRWGMLNPVTALRRTDVGRGTPTVDGVVDRIWSKATTVSTTVQVSQTPRPATSLDSGTPGATATAKLLWDAGHLYVLATVTDPALDESSANTYEQDSIEIFVDPDNSKSTGYNDDDGLYRISFSNRETITGNFDAFAIADNLRSATRTVPGGYVVEASIELDTVHPAAGNLIGFDLQVNDATAGARTSVRTWQDPTGQSYLDTSRWGVVRLS